MPSHRTKEKQVSIRLTAADLAVLERSAAAAMLSVATYVRQKALQAAERDAPERRRRLRVADALSALRGGLTAPQARRLRAAARRSE